MHRSTGKLLGDDAHLVQSIGDILATPIGSRVMRRDYGSLLPELIDAPVNPASRLALFAATAVALSRWEPRIRLRRVALERGERPGAFTVTIEGHRTDLPARSREATLRIPLTLSPASPAAAIA